MEPAYMQEERFDKINYSQKGLIKGEYECCRFVDCDFSNSSLIDINFIDCVFEGCNLSMVKLSNTIFRDIKFINCKMLGLYFDKCNEFGLSVNFENCNLNHS
jgi:fluoroquinolone resistance protein